MAKWYRAHFNQVARLSSAVKCKIGPQVLTSLLNQRRNYYYYYFNRGTLLRFFIVEMKNFKKEKKLLRYFSILTLKKIRVGTPVRKIVFVEF